MNKKLIIPYLVVVLGLVFSVTILSRSLRANEKLLKIQLAVTECTINDTPTQCRERQVERQRREGIARVFEVDCRVRNALKELPLQPPTERCVLQ